MRFRIAIGIFLMTYCESWRSESKNFRSWGRMRDDSTMQSHWELQSGLNGTKSISVDLVGIPRGSNGWERGITILNTLAFF